MPNWIQLLSGGCAYMDAPFAVHSLDQSRAQQYKDAVLSYNLTAVDVVGHVLVYAAQRGWTAQVKGEQLVRVIKFVF